MLRFSPENARSKPVLRRCNSPLDSTIYYIRCLSVQNLYGLQNQFSLLNFISCKGIYKIDSLWVVSSGFTSVIFAVIFPLDRF
jgi:hypothetical protein